MVKKVREEEDVTGQVGLFRYRITLVNGDLLKLMERVEVKAGKVEISKYRHHWQKASGEIVKRWDNAPHHPQVKTFPHHLHEGSEDKVIEHLPVNALQVLQLVSQSI